jgi:hypothetical protein
MEKRLRSPNEQIPITKLDQWIEVQQALVDDAEEQKDFRLLSEREQRLARLREYRGWLLAPVDAIAEAA